MDLHNKRQAGQSRSETFALMASALQNITDEMSLDEETRLRDGKEEEMRREGRGGVECDRKLKI